MIGSVTISYILKAICSVLHNIIFVSVSFELDSRVIILSLIALVLSILCVIISELKIANKIPLKINHKSLHDDIWQDVIDYKNGTTLKFTCDDVVYTGKLLWHEEKGKDSYFAIAEYIIDENGIRYNAKKMPYPSILVINMKDVKRVELFYGKEEKSKLRKWLEKNKFFGRFFKDEESEEQDN